VRKPLVFELAGKVLVVYLSHCFYWFILNLNSDDPALDGHFCGLFSRPKSLVLHLCSGTSTGCQEDNQDIARRDSSG
jgi:hypothetical protein